jgi:protein-tyrosine-phosphatase
MPQRALNVLFVCERNSIRNIMAEALLNRFSDGHFGAFSADLEPAAEVHPLTLDILKVNGMGTANLKPRSLSEFTAASAPRMDFVICMGKGLSAALPSLPGNPMLVEWGISEPSSADGDQVAQKFAFRRALRELETRIRLLVLVLVRPSRGSERGVEAEPQAQNA